MRSVPRKPLTPYQKRTAFIGFDAPRELKRDLKRLAVAEDRPMAHVIIALLRAGFASYFALAGNGEAVQKLRAKMEVAFEAGSG